MQRGTKVQQTMDDDGCISKLPQETNLNAVHAFFSSLRKGESVIIEKDIKHPKFKTFLKRTLSFTTKMSALQLSDIAIGILYSKPLQQLEIAGNIQDALIMKMQELPFQRILQLDYVIRKTKSNHPFEIVQLELQNVFLANVEHCLRKHNKDFRAINNIASYMCNHPEIVQAYLLREFSSVLLAIEDSRLKCNYAMLSIIKMFSKFYELDEQSKNALKKVVKIWIDLNLATNDVEMMLSLISESEKINNAAFEESGLIRFVVHYLDENCDTANVRRCCEHLIKMGYWRQSIDSLSKLFNEKSFELDVHIFIQMCSACEKFGYKPNNWETSIFPALRSFDFRLHIDEVKNISWPEFVLKLHSLGHCDTRLIEAVLGSPKFKESIYIDHLKMIPLQTLIKSMEEVIGSKNIMVDHQIDEKCTIPFLLLMNLKTKQFLPIAWKCACLRPNEQLIGIIIAKEGNEDGEPEPIESDGNRIKLIKFIPSLWLALPENDRKSLLLKKIDDMCYRMS